jgi:hypothetical protein
MLSLSGSTAWAREMTPVGLLGGFLIADGGRWAVSGRPGGMLLIDAAGRRLVLRNVGLAEPCGSQFFRLPSAVGAGQVLFECAVSDNPAAPRALMYDIRRGTFTKPPGVEALYRMEGADGIDLTGVGRRWWSAGLRRHSALARPVLVSRHDGRIVPAPTDGSAVIDLGSKTGTATVCERVRAHKPDRLLGYRAPYGLVAKGSFTRPVLVLRTCAGPSVTLGRTLAAAESARLDDAYVTWMAGGSVVARELRSGRTPRWRSPGGIGVRRAGRHVLTMRQEGRQYGFRFLVFDGVLP